MKKSNNQEKPIIGVNNYVEHSMNILDRIHELLQEKFDGKQKVLAKKLGKSEAEISKWFNGVQNFTLFTIAKLEEAFEDVIIAVHTNDYNADYVQAKSCMPVTTTTKTVAMYIDTTGGLYEKEFIQPKKFVAPITTNSETRTKEIPQTTLA